MKKYLLVYFFTTLVFESANAQQVVKSEPTKRSLYAAVPMHQSAYDQDKDLTRFKRMKISGFILGGAGVALATTGIVLSAGENKKTSGTLILVGGLAAVAGSSFIIAHANKRIDELNALSAGITNHGLGLTYRF